MKGERREMEGKKKKRRWGELGFYHFQLVPGAVLMAWRPAVFSSAQFLTLLPNASLCFSVCIWSHM